MNKSKMLTTLVAVSALILSSAVTPAAARWGGTTEIDDEFCTHALLNRTDGSRVRAIEAGKDWPVAEVRRSLKDG
jgi:hypothetical protein